MENYKNELDELIQKASAAIVGIQRLLEIIQTDVDHVIEGKRELKAGQETLHKQKEDFDIQKKALQETEETLKQQYTYELNELRKATATRKLTDEEKGQLEAQRIEAARIKEEADQAVKKLELARIDNSGIEAEQKKLADEWVLIEKEKKVADERRLSLEARERQLEQNEEKVKRYLNQQ